ncbi:MAG: arylsulfatase [Phycisphaerales bacterium]|nr:arylsulfatase [Phycisphaerales bacterium]
MPVRPASLCLLLALTSPVTGLAAEPGEPPSVVLVMTDDQGYGDLSCHGNPVLQTPNLDALAHESARLGTFYVQPVCAPTRAALMTGRVPQRTTAIDTWIARAMLESSEVTIAERLKPLGYATGIFGKWHLGDCHPMRPIDQGFDTALVHLGGGIGQPSDLEGGERKYTDPVLARNGVPEAFEGYCTDIFFDEAMKWIGKQDDPFLCVITTNAPHGPYHDVPPELHAKYSALDLDPVGADNADRMAREFAMIENIDENMGRLMATLDELGIDENTLVLFMHDNGPQWNRYNRGLRGIKGSVYDGGIRSPFFARWPARIPAGDRPEAVGQHVDVVPTILEAVGAFHAKEGFDGRSLMGVLQGREDGNFDRAIVVQSHRGDVPVMWHNAMIRRGDWKLVNASGFGKELEEAPRQLELFNLRDDPGEQADLAGKHPEVVARLAAEYEAWFEEVGANDPANYVPPTISIGAVEGPVMLTRQDWRRKAKGGWWNGRGDGSWRVEVFEEGPYRMRVRFLPKQPPPQRVQVLFNGEELAATDVGESNDVTFDSVRLPVGIGNIEVPMFDEKGAYGAYQVILDRVQQP